MARSPVAKALDAAAELDAWLARDPLPPVHPAGAGGPSRPDAGAGATGGAGEGNTRPSRPPPDAPAPVRHAGAVGMPHHPAPAHTDWLYHHLTVTGPTDDVARFRAAAAGAGVVPWAVDWDRLEEDWAHLLLAPPPPQHRTLSAAGARVLAGELREAAQCRHEAALARVGRGRACPFDLHALVPVPADVLALGPDHPDALTWLWAHWGTTQPLRHVQERGGVADGPDQAAAKTRRLPSSPKAIPLGDALRHPRPFGDGSLRDSDVAEGSEAPPEARAPKGAPGQGRAAMHLAFWSADWTPWRAIARVRQDWPTLRLDVRPIYEPG